MHKVLVNGMEVMFTNVSGPGWCVSLRDIEAWYDIRTTLERHFKHIVYDHSEPGCKCRKWVSCSGLLEVESDMLSYVRSKGQERMKSMFDYVRSEQYLDNLPVFLHEPYLKPDPQGSCKLQTPSAGGPQEMVYLDEPNFYRLVCRSNKPRAREFEYQVFNVILPSIRKTGTYAVPEPRQIEAPRPKSLQDLSESAKEATSMSIIALCQSGIIKPKDAAYLQAINIKMRTNGMLDPFAYLPPMENDDWMGAEAIAAHFGIFQKDGRTGKSHPIVAALIELGYYKEAGEERGVATKRLSSCKHTELKPVNMWVYAPRILPEIRDILFTTGYLSEAS